MNILYRDHIDAPLVVLTIAIMLMITGSELSIAGKKDSSYIISSISSLTFNFFMMMTMGHMTTDLDHKIAKVEKLVNKDSVNHNILHSNFFDITKRIQKDKIIIKVAVIICILSIISTIFQLGYHSYSMINDAGEERELSLGINLLLSLISAMSMLSGFVIINIMSKESTCIADTVKIHEEAFSDDEESYQRPSSSPALRK